MTETLSGYDLILETVGRKGTSYSEISVSSDGVVAKKGSALTSLQLIGEEVTYVADLNQDGEIGLLPAGVRSDYGSARPLFMRYAMLVMDYWRWRDVFNTPYGYERQSVEWQSDWRE